MSGYRIGADMITINPLHLQNGPRNLKEDPIFIVLKVILKVPCWIVLKVVSGSEKGPLLDSGKFKFLRNNFFYFQYHLTKKCCFHLCFRSKVAKLLKKERKKVDRWRTSLVAIISRHECIASCETPMSATRMPRLAESLGPRVWPHLRSLISHT